MEGKNKGSEDGWEEGRKEGKEMKERKEKKFKQQQQQQNAAVCFLQAGFPVPSFPVMT